jgi:hypothetical protein
LIYWILFFAFGTGILLKSLSMLGFWAVKSHLSTALSTVVVDINKKADKSDTYGYCTVLMVRRSAMCAALSPVV